ncbi:hypothetical protein GOARA_008_00450 [Gordonia araii NBRC 100433]|uniref:Knr4/Smi1-like domain-containing protein n=1 Tax=Gordonia araii NBRC 100433 TaxID=1073574 RepID=G7GXM0_9ACTN|nr:hypothetical protein [Gordonia araii]NNG98216.1 hypothetical protein [Gordonia araii NBRC 100433]GAB08345.1 hypothetical protein GOARA_008_00450 [Gordonia araii NBRC 100433]
MTTIDDLITLVPPPAAPPEFDFDACEKLLGTRLPDDYKDIVAVYGTGEFNDDLTLWVPQHSGIADDRTITTMAPSALRTLTDMRPTIPETSVWLLPDGREEPVNLGTVGPGAFLGWGRDTGGNYGFWKITGDDPNDWPIVFGDFGGAWDFDPRGLLEYLYAKLAGRFPDSLTGNYDPADPFFSSAY